MALTVSQSFNEFRSRLELSNSFQERVTTHHNAIRHWIESYDSTTETKLIGSLQRKSRIQPLPTDIFDMDILVILGNFHSWAPPGQGISHTDALNRLDEIMREHEGYEKMDPEKDFPTVIINYADGTRAELVPAYRDYIADTPPKGRGYWIPKRDRWVLADYDYDAEYISSRNRETKGYLIPTIKMLKAAKRNLFPEMKSYHLEVLGTEIIPSMISYLNHERYQISYPTLVYSFFLIGKDQIMEPAKIPQSKSPRADEYLANSRKRELATKLQKTTNYCGSFVRSDGKETIEAWKNLFGDPFPSYGLSTSWKT